MNPPESTATVQPQAVSRRWRASLGTVGWHEDYIEKKRRADRIRRKPLLERKCAWCGDWFLVAPNRPDTDYCPDSACKQRRSRELRREGS